MTELKITKGGIETSYQIPTEWSEVTVAQFKRWSQGLNEKKGLDNIITSVSNLSGCPEELLWELPYDRLSELTEAIGFIARPVDHTEVDTITIKDEEYHLKKDFNQMTIGEVKAIEELSQGSIIENLTLLLTIFCRRKVDGEWETITNRLLEEKDKFNSVPISYVWKLFEDFSNGVAS
jgi:hypothetical protein